MPLIPVQRYALFAAASRLLYRYRRLAGVALKPTAVEIALAIQATDQLPKIGSAQGVPLHELGQLICDPFYAKRHPQLPTAADGAALIWPLFNQGDDGYIQPLTPQPEGSLAKGGHEQRWFKACNSQAGVGCHAVSPHLWEDSTFLNGDRDLCPFRLYDGRYPLAVDQGRQRCGFDDNPCGWQSGYPKLLQVIGRSPKAAVFQSEWSEAMWHMLVPREQRLPVYPLLVVLYFGSEILNPHSETAVSPEHLQQVLALPSELFEAVFDLDQASPLNRRLLSIQADSDEDLAELAFRPYSHGSMTSLSLPTGGRVVIDPDEPPSFSASGLPSSARPDPLTAERRRRRQLERTPEHNELLQQFRRWFRLAGLEVREDSKFFDFLAVAPPQVLLAEVKLLYYQDMAESIQELIGQILYYERFTLGPWLEQGYSVLKAGVFDRPPLGEYIQFLSELGIHVFWLDASKQIDGPEESLRILRQIEVQVRPDLEIVES
ncbi:hypothetical protein [Leptolyngbya sp. FACHB-261]|uniref:hypothetical protein n=1 Tax=Leptolyngbya sp. FACHB-261 TaxID=2692806 RepID=UPI001683F5C7|nr:hypothetical protein [Leptolyngbya sp. FACHB-261]MBD2104603.1 hypothetical protein [Leptolyngbya sp. FACHB-261]